MAYSNAIVRINGSDSFHLKTPIHSDSILNAGYLVAWMIEDNDFHANPAFIIYTGKRQKDTKN